MTDCRAALLVLLGLLGCRVGLKVKNFPAAHGPQGVAVRLRAVSQISGELLAVEDTALLVREHSGGLVRAPFRVIKGADVTKMGSGGLGGGRTPSPDKIARLRLVSRFPQGLSPDVLHRLLALNQQSEVKIVGQ